MRYTVFKSLDESPVTFGIRGSYFNIVLVGAGISVILGIVVGAMTASLFGFLAFLLGCAVAYFTTLVIQGRYSEREKKRWIASRNLPTFVRVQPGRMSGYFDFVSDDLYGLDRRRKKVRV